MQSTQPMFAAIARDDQAAALDLEDAAREDAYWRRAFWCQGHYRQGLDYEDYAPAYCVGYIGYAQYGGEYEDAEPSLWANWQRIRGDSRLTLESARGAMRAAWDRMAVRDELSAQRPGQPGLYRASSTMDAAPG